MDYLKILTEWFERKVQLNAKKIESDYRYKKGDIWYVDFGVNIGNEFNKQRPALILTNNKFSKGNNVLVAPITSFNLEKKILHTDIILEPNNILKQKSIIRTNHLRDISKKRLIKKVGRVADEILQELDIQLKELFDIRT